MANLHVEARPKGRPEGTRIDDFVEDHADNVLHTSSTQKQAIDWAKAQGHRTLVARVRHLNDKKNPDHWRQPRTRRKRADGGVANRYAFNILGYSPIAFQTFSLGVR